MNLTFSIRGLAALAVAIFLALVFHDFATEIVIGRYWIIAATTFLMGALIARGRRSRTTVIPLAISLPTFFVFIYASAARSLIIDPEGSNLLFNMPAIEPILERILGFWSDLRGKVPPGSIDVEGGLPRTLLTVATLGIMSSTTLGLISGLVLSHITRNNNA